LTGKVIHGNKLGRTIGFPTANLAIEQATKILPEIGVYAVKVKINGLVYSGVMNVGKKPTVMQTDAISVEVFIFDFSADIYDQVISVSVYHRLRGEQRFESVDLLKQQLAKDATLARTYLAALS
jgi:riboflavin kinase/FMN adenylyltransferase